MAAPPVDDAPIPCRMIGDRIALHCKMRANPMDWRDLSIGP
jgi:hypothetical protein